MNDLQRKRNMAVAAVDQLDAQLDEALSRIDIDLLCAIIENVTMMSDASAKEGNSLTFCGDRRLWRIMAACAMTRLNEELVKRHDEEVRDGDE